jgi:peptidyl-prolyl cis-trans isomerase C
MKRVIVFLLVSAGLLWLPSLVLSAEKEKPKEQKKEQQGAQQSKEQSEQQTDPTKRVLAKIGNIVITQHEFDVQFKSGMERITADKRSMFINPHGRRQFLAMLVDEKVWVNGALEAGYDKDPEVKMLLDMTLDQLVMRKYYEKEIIAKATPTETEVRKFYDENPDRFKGPVKAKARHIALSDSTEAERVLAQLKRGADFAKLAKEKSNDTSTADKGGDLGMLIQGTALPRAIAGFPQLERALFSLKSGGLSDVIKTSSGYQILRIDERTEPELKPFESVKARIEEGLTGERENKIRSELFQELKKKFPVEYLIEDSSLTANKNVTPPEVATTPEELFQAAMDSNDSLQRISIYEELLKKFPESKYASQAQFMIGFIYSEELKDYTKAEGAFKVVIEKYPDSELVDSAKWMIRNMRNESQKVGTVEDVKRKAKQSSESGRR